MRRSPRTRLLAASVAALATFAFAACGGDDDDDTTDGSDVTLSTEVDDTTPTEDTTTEDTTTDDTTGDDTIAPDDTTDGSTPSSGSGEVGERDEYLEAAKTEVAFEDADINDCVAEAIVSEDIYAAIQEAGLTVEDFQSEGPAGLELDEADAEVVAGELAECGDLLSAVLAGEDEVQLQCAQDNMTNDQVAEFLAFSLLGLEPSSEVTDANDAVDECIQAASPTTTG